MRRSARTLMILSAVVATTCGREEEPSWEEQRVPCADRNPLRNLYFGDLHVHTGWSFDAWNADVRVTPEEAYAYARGAEVHLPPLDAAGDGTLTVVNDRPLDFAAVTEHAEFLAEVQACQDPTSNAYDSETCVMFRMGGPNALVPWGIALGSSAPIRFSDVCGEGADDCVSRASDVWTSLQETADAHYDRTEACSFTSFVAYEWSGTSSLANLHRNVIFRSERVPSAPISHYEAPTVPQLLGDLDRACVGKIDGCDFLSIPHNTNWSNGNMYIPETSDGAEARERVELSARYERLLEIFQHKGDAECSNGFSSLDAPPDEFCDFEKLRRIPFTDCGEDTGSNGIVGQGCVSRRDFLRGILVSGLEQWTRYGTNPFEVGVSAATDTHNGTPGRVDEATYVGHFGDREIDREGRLFAAVPSGPRNSPGGLLAVWAEENSRGALFDAMQRREVYGTSGPRIGVRMFAGDLPEDLCDRGDFVSAADAAGVPMGATLEGYEGAAMRVAVRAERDVGTPTAPGRGLERLQVVKGWIGTDGSPRVEVIDVDGIEESVGVDEATCAPTGEGSPSLCAVWTDPDFDPNTPTWYYARVLEAPVCRWSWRDCLSYPASERPALCDDPEMPRQIRERAWTSPVWSYPRSVQAASD